MSTSINPKSAKQHPASEGPPTSHAGANGQMPPDPDIFDNLDALRLTQDAVAAADVREALRHVPVRKPNRREFVRVHPAADMCLFTGVYVDKEERETYLVLPALRLELVGELSAVTLTTAITRQGVVFLWPVPMPDETGRRNAWAETAREACELAKTSWVRLAADMSLGAYRIYNSEAPLPEPVWPDKTLSQLLKLAFKDSVVDRSDHPIIKRLRGLS